MNKLKELKNKEPIFQGTLSDKCATAIKKELENFENTEFLSADETAKLLGIKKVGLGYFQKATGIKCHKMIIKAVFYPKQEILKFANKGE